MKEKEKEQEREREMERQKAKEKELETETEFETDFGSESEMAQESERETETDGEFIIRSKDFKLEFELLITEEQESDFGLDSDYEVAVTGSIPLLGEWKQGKKLLKYASTANSTVWTLSIEVGRSPPPPFEYKFFLIVDRLYIYEGGSSRSYIEEFDTPDGKMNINCIWQNT
eukprot:TRINITY_DN4200_c0_g3_i1.p1 TRINITY_DN4200_c0_g3~~TRINITY_DN4200_c0_g3_i1.p1  ORF type:complete len:172 (+),score=61.14 TRINITY_DN4200_c0_g3_i1:63-578(+)